MLLMDEIVIYDNGRCEGRDDKYGYIIHSPPRHNYVTIHEQDGNIIRMCLEYATSKYKKALNELSHYQCLFSNNKYVLKSPLIYNNGGKVYKKSNKNLTSVRWDSEAKILPLTGDVIIKGKIDYEMEATLILYKYNYYLRYMIEWPVLMNMEDTCCSVTSTGVWYNYTIIRKEGFIINDDNIHSAFIPAIRIALNVINLPTWALDIIPQSLLINNTTTTTTSTGYRLPQVANGYINNNDNNNNITTTMGNDKVNPFIQLPTLSYKDGCGLISMVITPNAIINLLCGRDGDKCLIASNDGKFNIISSRVSSFKSSSDNLFWTFITTPQQQQQQQQQSLSSSTTTHQQIWSSRSLPKSSMYIKEVELVRKAMRYIIINNKTKSLILSTKESCSFTYDNRININELNLLHERVWDDIGCFFCYKLPHHHNHNHHYDDDRLLYYNHLNSLYYYRCLFNDKIRIIFYSSDKGGKGIDEANGLFKFMDINGNEKEISWSGPSRRSYDISPYADAALTFVRWVISIDEEKKTIINNDKQLLTSEMVENIIQQSRDLRTLHKLGGKYLYKINNENNNNNVNEEEHYENEDYIINSALDSTRAFLNTYY